jgi:Protein of unknown function (DUF3421)
MNKKYLSTLVSTLGIAIVSLGSLVAITQPALAGYRWVTGRSGSVPTDAVKAGSDNNDDLYVCRTNLGNGKLHPQYKNCYVPYGSTNQAFTTYEVLVGNNLRWVPLAGSIPQNSISGGRERNGDPLYVCRSRLPVGKKQLTPGKYSAVNKICYLPYGSGYYEDRAPELLVELAGSSPSISGEVTFTNDISQTSLTCQDLKVYLTSIEKSPPSPDSLLNIRSPIFEYSEPMSGDIKTGKCNYSIKAFSIDAGKKATIGVAGAQPNNVTIPTRNPIKMNFKAVYSERPIIN